LRGSSQEPEMATLHLDWALQIATFVRMMAASNVLRDIRRGRVKKLNKLNDQTSVFRGL
jgi:hypothetical protein